MQRLLLTSEKNSSPSVDIAVVMGNLISVRKGKPPMRREAALPTVQR